MHRILIFGGAFNPPTTAHEAIIAAALRLPTFDEVWVMPSGDRLDKQIAASDKDRMAMARLLKKTRFNHNPRLKIFDFELKLPRPSQTFRTFGALQKAFPDTAFWFIFGADSYDDMPSWEQGRKLRQKLQVILIARSGQPRRNEQQYLEIADSFADISASKIRRLIAGHKPIDQLVSSDVARYIADHRLYAKPTV